MPYESDKKALTNLKKIKIKAWICPLIIHSSPLRLVQIPDYTRHSLQFNSIQTKLNHFQQW